MKIIPHILFVSLLLCSCTSQKSVVDNYDFRALARSGLALGFDIEEHDDHTLFLEAASWMGVPYKYGGNSKRGIDCSGLTCAIYREVYGKKLPRTCRQQFAEIKRVNHSDELKSGDLLFFHTSPGSRECTHVGIYLKDGRFLHASSYRGVVTDVLHSKYWSTHWLGGGRKKN